MLNQTCEDFELIVVDDGSTDGTKEAISSFSDRRIRYVHQQNSGLPACARNRGMTIARGNFIALLDGDDYWYARKLERCKQIFGQRSDIDLVCHNEDIVYNDKVLRRTSYGPYAEDMHSRLLFKGNCLHPSAVTIRRRVFFDDGFKFCEDKALFTIEDYEYWLRLSAKYRFYFLPDILGCYRVTENGIFMAGGDANTLNMLKLLDSHFAWISDRSGKAGKMIDSRRSSVMSAAGRMYHHKNDFQKSRQWYLDAIKEYPLNYKAYIGFMAASLGLRIIYK